MRRVYFDYAASTPVDPDVERAMRPYFKKVFGNAGAAHWFGQQASAAIFEARQKIAKALNCHYQDIIFTGSATEANNLVIRGVLGLASERALLIGKPRIITSAIEHDSVLETCRDLEKQGLAEVVYIPVNKLGLIDLEKIKKALNERTVLVSIMYANNQIGTIQPIKEVVKIILGLKNKPLFHTDAVQAFQFLKCDVEDLGVDILTFSGHKIYGPKGIGALVVKKTKLNNSLRPIITGGGQEWGLRSGTENTPSIVGLGKAVELTENLRTSEFRRLEKIRDYFWNEIKKIVPDVQLNGSEIERLPNYLNIYFPGRPAQDLQIELDLWGVAVSPGGAACSSRLCLPSYAIEALGFSADRALSSLRFSLGKYTTRQEIHLALKVLKRRFVIK